MTSALVTAEERRRANAEAEAQPAVRESLARTEERLGRLEQKLG